MNTVQRRIFRAFVDAGGDLSREAEVDRLMRHVNASIMVMQPKLKRAVRLALNADERLCYRALAARLVSAEGAHVTEVAFRQRVSRGVRALESAIRSQPRMRAGAAA